MSNSQLFIPKKCKAGFNLRSDTYSGRLAYIIPFDGKNWRKEKSWESWRKKEGESKQQRYDYASGRYIGSDEKYGEEVRPVEFDNVPTSGFVLNKKVGGYKSDWNMRQTYARVFDPRGFEFEINIVNLLYILETCNCMKGKGLEGDFVYSWDGKDLVLLPCSSWEYEKANVFTNLQDKKISAKNLVPGLSYKTKKEVDVVYVGRYPWHEFDTRREKGRGGKKYHIFTSDDGKTFDLKSNMDFLAQVNSDLPVSNFADIIDKFKNNTHSSKIVEFKLKPRKLDLVNTKNDFHGRKLLQKTKYYSIKDDILTMYCVRREEKWDHDSSSYALTGYLYCAFYQLNIKTQQFINFDRYWRDEWIYASGISTDYWNYNKKCWSEDEIRKIADQLNFSDLTIILENGKEIQLTETDYLHTI